MYLRKQCAAVQKEKDLVVQGLKSENPFPLLI